MSPDVTRYPELKALDPAQGGEGRWIGIDCPKKPCLATFCVRADRGLDEIARLASKHYDIGSIKDFSRENTEGKTLRWRLAADHHSLGYEKLPFQGLVPFIVDWSVNALAHPSDISPKGCRLVELRAYHPKASELQKVLDALNVKGVTVVSVESSETPRLEAVLDCPKGQVKIWSCKKEVRFGSRWEEEKNAKGLEVWLFLHSAHEFLLHVLMQIMHKIAHDIVRWGEYDQHSSSG